MFGAIGAINKCITASLAGLTEVININVDSLKILSETGNDYVKQFEAEAQLALAKKKAELAAQLELTGLAEAQGN